MGRPKKEKPNHASGMYEVKITIGHTFDGKPIRKSFYSSVSKSAAKAKAEQFKIDQAVSIQTNSPFVSKKECFDTWAKIVLDNLRGTIKDSSYNLTYKNSINNHLIPYFGKRKLTEIRQIDVQQYFKKKGHDLSIETLKKHKIVYKQNI